MRAVQSAGQRLEPVFTNVRKAEPSHHKEVKHVSTTPHAERRRECSAKSSHFAVRRAATSCDRRSDNSQAGARKRSSDERCGEQRKQDRSKEATATRTHANAWDWMRSGYVDVPDG